MKNLTIIFPIYEFYKFSRYIDYNLDVFKKLKIHTLLISNNKDVFKYKNKYVKVYVNKKFKNAQKKFEYGIKKANTEYIYLMREDTLIHEYGFKKIFNKLNNNKNLISTQGIQFIALSKNYNLVYPHNPNSVNYDCIKNQSIKLKIFNILKDAPELYWTFHKTKIFRKFWFYYFSKGVFNDKNLSEYWLIFFILAHGEISFEKIPINLKIKNKKVNKREYAFANHKKNKKYYYDLSILSEIFRKKRNVKKSSVKKYIEDSFLIRSQNLKPRDLLKSFGYVKTKILVLKKYFVKLSNALFFKKNIISKYDKFYVSSFSNEQYNELINNKNYENGFKKLMDKLIK